MATVSRLSEDSNTKRAVISLYDPSCDFGDTKDVPCNNWLQFIHRNGVPDCHVTVRANDVIWGFSGINCFEWSVLQELLARSFGWSVGVLSWYVGTFHVYERHYQRISSLLRLKNAKSFYEYGIKPTAIHISVKNLDGVLDMFFAAEKCARLKLFHEAAVIERQIADRFFNNATVMMRLYNMFLHQESRDAICSGLQLLEDDFFLPAFEYFFRKWGNDSGLMSLLSGDKELFFQDYAAHFEKTGAVGAAPGIQAF